MEQVGQGSRLSCSCFPSLFPQLPSFGPFLGRAWGKSVTCKLRWRLSYFLIFKINFLIFHKDRNVLFQGALGNEAPLSPQEGRYWEKPGMPGR